MQIGRVTLVLLLVAMTGVGFVAGLALGRMGRRWELAAARQESTRAHGELERVSRLLDHRTTELERVNADAGRARTSEMQARQAAHDLQSREAALERRLRELRAELHRVDADRARLQHEADRSRNRFDEIVGLDVEARSLRVIARRVPDLEARVRELEAELGMSIAAG